MEDAFPSNISAIRALVPHRSGDLTPAGGGRCLPIVLKRWPMKPSGVQLARPIFPPGRQTRISSAAARSWSGVNMTPKVETTTSKLASWKGALPRRPRGTRSSARRPRRGAGAVEQGRNVVGRRHVAPTARRRQRGVAVAGSDVQHRLPGADVEGLAQVFADDLQGGADDGIVAGRPRPLLADFDGGQIGLPGLECWTAAAGVALISNSS